MQYICGRGICISIFSVYVYVCSIGDIYRCETFRYFNHLDACLLEIPSMGKIHLFQRNQSSRILGDLPVSNNSSEL